MLNPAAGSYDVYVNAFATPGWSTSYPLLPVSSRHPLSSMDRGERVPTDGCSDRLAPG